MSSLSTLLLGPASGGLEAEPLGLSRLPAREQVLKAGEELSAGSCGGDCILVVEGLLGRYRLLRDGNRQLLSFHLSGDACDLHKLVDVDDCVTTAFTRCRILRVPVARLQAFVQNSAAVGHALWRRAAQAERIRTEWLVSLGRRDAYSRLAHLFCEMLTRHRAIGAVVDDSCDFPLTQSDLADALGLSIVHVNRVMQRLRAEGLLLHKGGRLHVLDLERLEAVADFDPAYLRPSLSRPDVADQGQRRASG